ncbi:heme peroxidase [Mycena vitilis]|nr:heme peroxidase [Mycena vitilis]
MEAFGFLLPHRWNLPVYASLIYFALVRGLPRLSNFHIILPRWWNMPLYIAVLYIGATRDHLSQHNLYDTYLPGERPIVSCDGINPGARTLSGICKSLEIPEMGSAGSRYARFVPINRTYGETDTSYTPDPRAISQHLLKRESFMPAISSMDPVSNTRLVRTYCRRFRLTYRNLGLISRFSHETANHPNAVMSFPLPENNSLRATGPENCTTSPSTGNNFSDVLHTFGTDNPGALVLGNYPAAMMSLSVRGTESLMDLGAINILRDRERGVPRYNEFRRLFSLTPATMGNISDKKEAVAALRSIYGEDVESVDLLAGTLAETPRVTGFAFSNTAFQVFTLAESRRSMTDRLFTTAYRPVSTQEDIDWIEKCDFRAVIGRTVPELNATAHSVDNAFKPCIATV